MSKDRCGIQQSPLLSKVLPDMLKLKQFIGLQRKKNIVTISK